MNQIDTKKLPPQNIDAERSILGGILIENEAIHNVLEIINSDDFYDEHNKIIFENITTLAQANKPIDIITLTEELKKGSKLEGIGGAAYIAYLTDTVATAANIDYYATIVKEKSLLRQLITRSTEVITEAYNIDVDILDFIDRAEKNIFEIAQKHNTKTYASIKEIIKESFTKIEKLYERKEAVTGVPSGFRDLDKMTSGFQNSDLIIIAGRPSMGKTAFCLNAIGHASIKSKVPCLFFSLEMSKEQLGVRLLSSEGKVDSTRIRSGFLKETDWHKLAKSASSVAEAPLFIDDTPGISITEIRARARRLKREFNLGLIVIDYLQLINVRGRVGYINKIDSREQEISFISRSLKALAKELNVPVIALSQLNRAVEQRHDKRPMMADLRESGAIEQDADVIAFIYRDEVYNEESEDKGIAEIIIGKQRNGPIGHVKLSFVHEYTRFENLEKEAKQES